MRALKIHRHVWTALLLLDAGGIYAASSGPEPNIPLFIATVTALPVLLLLRWAFNRE